MENTYKVNKKAVEKIIERVYDNGSTVINKNDLEEIFPELKESDDERIRKALIEYFRWVVPQILSGFDNKEVLAWLEKQGEQKESYIDMSLVDAVRFCVAGNLAHKSTDDNGNTIGFGVYIDDTTAQKLTNELSDIFQKPIEWSEDDKRIIDNLISQLGNLYARKLIKEETKDKYVNLLKSIKERYTWKPSGFHLECISDAIAMYQERGINAIGLKEILEELKKLKG